MAIWRSCLLARYRLKKYRIPNTKHKLRIDRLTGRGFGGRGKDVRDKTQSRRRSNGSPHCCVSTVFCTRARWRARRRIALSYGTHVNTLFVIGQVTCTRVYTHDECLVTDWCEATIPRRTAVRVQKMKDKKPTTALSSTGQRRPRKYRVQQCFHGIIITSLSDAVAVTFEWVYHI